MNRRQLEHAIRAACEVADDEEVWVFGSQAILGQYPEAPVPLLRSMEVDVLPKNHPERTEMIDGALGELSRFQETHGFYVHGIPLKGVTLPERWEDRTIEVEGRGRERSIGRCLEAHDLALSKLAAFREKDRSFVRTLLTNGLVDDETLLSRLASMRLEKERSEMIGRWISSIAGDLRIT